MIKPTRTDPFIFRSLVNEAGYAWRKGLDSRFHLVPRQVAGTRFRLQEASAGLFWVFSELKPTKEAIVGFAGLYGDLFDKYDISDFVKEKGKITEGASWERWRAEIGDLSVLVNLWNQIQSRDRVKLRKTVVLEASKGIRYQIKTTKQQWSKWLVHPSMQDGSLGPFVKGDVVMPARYALQSEINRRLFDSRIITVPQLAWTSDRHQRLVFRPTNLLAAMWLQFAQAVTGEYKLKRCAACRKYFQVGPGGRRADAVTCTDSCRQRKSREAKASSK